MVAALLRVLPWLANYPLHRDEALYGYWARLIASGQDPLLLIPWIDKPPLSIYLAAGSIALLGPSELALRLPGMIASLLLVPATYALARRAYGDAPGLAAAGLVALSPFAILFAPTAFTDPWLTLWLVVAAWAALVQRGLLAGLAVGLAVASKQQGLLVAPLVIALLMLPPPPGVQRARSHRLKRLGAALLGFALIFGPLTGWDSLRWHNRPSFWDRSLSTYGPLTVAAPSEWLPRAKAWAEQIGYLLGAPALSWLAVAGALAVGLAGIWRLVRHGQSERRHWLDAVFAGYLAAFLALHIVVTFQPWDRYLLPLVPLVCVLVARGAGLAGQVGLRNQVFRRNLISQAGALALAVALGYAAWLGTTGRIPVGSDRSAYAGVQEVAASLRSQPDTAIIYHRSLGWYFDFYLFDAPQERRWYDTADKLARVAAEVADAEPGRPQWLIAVEWEVAEVEALRPALAHQNLTLTEAGQVHRPDGSRSFVLYQIKRTAINAGPLTG